MSRAIRTILPDDIEGAARDMYFRGDVKGMGLMLDYLPECQIWDFYERLFPQICQFVGMGPRPQIIREY